MDTQPAHPHVAKVINRRCIRRPHYAPVNQADDENECGQRLRCSPIRRDAWKDAITNLI
jgi:hypothetical protein